MKVITNVHQDQHETDIVNEIENYFSINGLSTPFEAVVNHLNKKMDLENAEKEIKDLVSSSGL